MSLTVTEMARLQATLRAADEWTPQERLRAIRAGWVPREVVADLQERIRQLERRVAEAEAERVKPNRAPLTWVMRPKKSTP